MRRPALALLLLALVFTGCTDGAAPPVPGAVAFHVDMNPAMAEGWFDPSEETVGVRGSVPPLAWDRTLAADDADGDGVYSVTVPFAPGTFSPIEYKFKVEGAENPNEGWENGPNRQIDFDPADAHLVRRVFDAEAPLVASTITGTVLTHADIASAHLGQPRDVYVYLPPGYDDNPTRRYPVLYMHDGQNLFDAASAGAEWEVDETAERLITEGEVAPVIIVGVASTPDRMAEYTPTERTWRRTATRQDTGVPITDPLSAFTGRFQVDGEADDIDLVFMPRNDTLFVQLPETNTLNYAELGADGTFAIAHTDMTFTYETDAEGRVARLTGVRPPAGGRGAAYGRFLVEEVMPLIEANYRTLDGPGNTALGGSSLGGLITMYLGLQYPETFGTLLVVSPSVWWDGRVLLGDVERLAAKTGQRVWMDMGTAEGPDMLDGARALRTALEGKGWRTGDDLAYVEAEGAPHNEVAWADRFDDMLRFAFPVTR